MLRNIGRSISLGPLLLGSSAAQEGRLRFLLPILPLLILFLCLPPDGSLPVNAPSGRSFQAQGNSKAIESHTVRSLKIIPPPLKNQWGGNYFSFRRKSINLRSRFAITGFREELQASDVPNSFFWRGSCADRGCFPFPFRILSTIL